MNNASYKALITGASGGIGGAVAQQLAAHGANLLLAGRNTARLQKLVSQLPGTGHKIVQADLTTDVGIAHLREVAEAFGVDTVINALGVNQLSTLEDMHADQVQAMVTTNLVAPMRVCQELLPFLKRQSAAMIVNVGSILGSIGYAGSTAYCATKFGLRGFTESLRRELSDSSVQVAYFAPRATSTSLNSARMNAMNQELGNAMDHPKDVAFQLYRLLSRRKSSRRYLGWPERFFVRLNSLLPGVVDRAVSKQLPIIKRYCSLGHSG